MPERPTPTSAGPSEEQVLGLVRRHWPGSGVDRLEALPPGAGGSRWCGLAGLRPALRVTHHRTSGAGGDLLEQVLAAVADLAFRLDVVVAALPAHDLRWTVPVPGGRLSVVPWVHGEPAQAGPDHRAQARRTLARLHAVRAPAGLPRWSPLPDDVLHAAATARPRLVERYAGLVARAPERPWVVTHGDPVPHHWLRTPVRDLLVDWTTARLAPRERDLAALTGPADDPAADPAADPAVVELFALERELRPEAGPPPRGRPVRGAWQRVALAMFAVGWGANQFTPLLVAYRDELGMSAQTRAFLFGVYAAGLVPALLLGGTASDRWGRRAVVLPAVALSPLATVLLVLAHDSTPGLAAARLLAGVCSGLVFGAASAWVSDLSVHDPGAAARRAAVALSAGFGVGPLVTGLVGEVVDHPLTVPYLPHLVVGVLAAVLLARVPGPRPGTPVHRAWLRVPAVCRGRRFVLVVVPFAPWVFGSVSTGFAFAPGELPPSPGELATTGLLTGGSLLTGVLVQPWAGRLEQRRPLLAAQVGVLAVVLGLVVCLVTLHLQLHPLLLASAPLLGVGYGCCLVAGLRETERLADPAEKGATVAVFYAATYVGFAAPYLLGAVAGHGAGPVGAVGVAVAVAVLSLVVPTLARTRT